jgi:ribose 5-phosphate isomerase B
MRIYIGADHGGYKLKEGVIEHLSQLGHEVIDVGAHTLEAEDDYPKYAYLLAVKLLGEEDSNAAHGILICGSGQGMSIAANRVRGIRAGLAWNVPTAKAARNDDNVNVLVLPARHISEDSADKIVDAWLEAKFDSSPKYQHRLDTLEELYG